MPRDIWCDLDDAAKANLTEGQFKEFIRYKTRLRLDGHKWENDAEDILTGYIWDESEETE